MASSSSPVLTEPFSTKESLTFEPRKSKYLGRKAESFDTGKKCDWKAGVKWTAVAIAIVGLLVGATGLGVYLGQLQLGLTGVGAMSTTVGLYTMLGGFGVTFITSILLAVGCCLAKAKNKSKKGVLENKDSKPWYSCFTSMCSKNDKKSQFENLQ